MLADWIDPRLLAAAFQQESRRRYLDDDDRIVVVDRLLVDHRFALLAECFSDHLAWRQEYKLFSSAAFVAPEIRAAAPDEERFLTNDFAVGARVGSRDTPAYRCHLDWLRVLESLDFARFLSALTGMDTCRCDGVRVKAFSAEHFLRPHSDANPSRMLCGVLYTSKAWPRQDRGAFEIYRNGVLTRTILPLPNRMVLFDPHAGHTHAIGRLNETSERRFNYSFWFRRPDSEP
jgi:hypothetical protein